MTNEQRIAYHKEEMLKPNSQKNYSIVYEKYWDKPGRYDKGSWELRKKTYKWSLYDFHKHCIKLLEIKSYLKYNITVMKYIKNIPNGLLFEIAPVGWNYIIKSGKYKDKKISDLDIPTVKWMVENDVFLFESCVYLFINSLESGELPQHYEPEKALQNTSQNINGGWANCTDLEIDSWLGCIPNH